MKRCLFGALALSFVACRLRWRRRLGRTEPPKSVPDSALTGSLLSPRRLNTIMGTSGMTPHTPVSQMGDHRNLLPNLNCLGVWQVNEAPIYESSHWKSVRQQLLRAPDTDQWDFLVVQSVVSYRTADAAREFFTESTDRWSKCTNHNVNIQLNGQTLPAWKSGDLTKTDNQLAMPYTRVAATRPVRVSVLSRSPPTWFSTSRRASRSSSPPSRRPSTSPTRSNRSCPDSVAIWLPRPRRRFVLSCAVPAARPSSACQRWQRDPVGRLASSTRTPDCGTAFSLSRTTFVNGFGFSSGVAGVFLSDGVVVVGGDRGLRRRFRCGAGGRRQALWIAPGSFMAVARARAETRMAVAGRYLLGSAGIGLPWG